MHPELSEPTPAIPGLPERGEIFDGKYRIDGVLGLDGMGVLLAATRLERAEHVAIKVLLPDGVEDPVLVQRFMREGKGSSKIRSEYVARATDVGLVEGRPYMVFEYAAGNEPSALVDTGGIRTSYGEAHFPAPRSQTPAPAARPPSARAVVESSGSTAPIVPMRSAAPGYIFAATVLLAMVAVVGWVLLRQVRAVREAEAHVEPPTVAAHFHLPPVPVLGPSAAPAGSSVVTTTSAVVSKSASVESAPLPGLAVAPLTASPAPAPVPTAPPAPTHHRHAHRYVPPRDHSAPTSPAPAADSDDNPYATPGSAPATAPSAPSDASGLFEIRK